MKVLILESCRRPEVNKGLTESLVLSKIFTSNDIKYELYSNDGIWTNQVLLDEALIRSYLRESSINIVHFAVHGTRQGLVLQWSNEPDIRHRVPIRLLTCYAIRSMKEFQGKLIVSGACVSAQFAEDFLAVGAKAFVAPTTEIPWNNLGLFFKTFYLSYRSLKSVKDALNKAINEFPEYNSYSLFQS